MIMRLATKADLPEIMDIYNQAIGQGFCTAHLENVDEHYMQGWFGRHRADCYPVYVCEEKEGLSGWVSLGPYREGRQALQHVVEVSYYVHQQQRGKGRGSRLLAHAIRAAPPLGFSVVLAILLENNPASVALLKKHQFSLWASLPGLALIDGRPINHLYYGRKL